MLNVVKHPVKYPEILTWARSLNSLILEDKKNKMSRNVSNQTPKYATQRLRRENASVLTHFMLNVMTYTVTPSHFMLGLKFRHVSC